MKALTSVNKALATACEASETMYNSCREAAKLAAKQLDAKKDIAPRVAEVRDLYADAYAGNSNVKSIFGDFLLLIAAEQAPVSLDTKDGEIHTTAKEAIELPKHQMRNAAKEVRQANGLGRKTGGGRKAKAESAEPANTAVASVKLTDFALCDRVSDAIDKPEWRKELATALLDQHGKAAAKKHLQSIIKELDTITKK